MSLRSTLLSSVALAAAFAAGVVTVISRDANFAEPTQAAQTGRATTPRTPAATDSPLPDLSDVAERAVRASVNISSTQQVRADPMTQFMYGVGVIPQTSLGSGVIVSTEGYLLTNSHVVQDPRAEIHVTLADNRELPATVVGIDTATDLAVLKVDARGIDPLPWGDSDKLRVAEWVLAVGNPFAFNQTVTFGIVSAQNRHDPQMATYNDFVQHDAAINPGNSGGALINARGELVGINTLIVPSGSGGYQGLSFAIPSSLARRIMEELIKSGEVVRGSIGNVQLIALTADQARRYDLGARGGVFVYRTGERNPNSAGLLPKDMIVRFDNKDITDENQLQRLIAEAKIGSTATVEVIRQGAPKTLRIPVVQRPQSPVIRR